MSLIKNTRLGLAGFLLCVSILSVQAVPLCLYVAQNGNDSWSGHLADPNLDQSDGPFATLERARDEIRKIKQAGSLPEGGVNVQIRAGVYSLEKPFELNHDDSGTGTSPIRYSAFSGEEVYLNGGKPVSGFKPVTDETVLQRMDDSAKNNVLQTDLKAQGITDFGPADEGGAELFFQDRPMTLARWPNEGFTRIADIVLQDKEPEHGQTGSKTGIFKYEGDRPSRWIHEKDPWLHGYWFWDWSDQRQKIVSIDTANAIISLATPYHGYGYRKGQWYYAFNMLSELDSPGEWYIDREQGILYFWPPEPIGNTKTILSIQPNLIVMKDASFIAFSGLTLEASRKTGVVVNGGENDQFAQCVFRNMGGNGAQFSGTGHRVIDSEIYLTGEGGVSLTGGDRPSLTPGNLCADNNDIHDYGRIKRMYTPGISLNGVGNRATHNLIHDAPHMAIYFGGNEHCIEYNEIHHVCQESNDAGAIYAGRNWTMRGNQIRFNYLHQITGFENRGCVGVYLDDMFASAAIYGNVFHQVSKAAFIGGGRDCTVENNLFVDCDPALHVDARALGWAHYHADDWIKEAQEKGTLLGIAYNQPPYSERYPQLIHILDENPKAPVGNVIARNICWGGKWDDIEEKARPFLTLQDNLIQEDPHFVNVEKLDFHLQPDSPAFKMGFKEIPLDQIGLKKNRSMGAAAKPEANDPSQTSIVWKACLRQSIEWYRTPEALRIAENVLLYQLDNGGWSKNIDMAAPLTDQDKDKLLAQKSQPEDSTIDNGATYTQMIYLQKVYNKTKQDRFKNAFIHGLNFLLAIQYENGGWPQFPHRKGYYAHITFNDNAMIGVMNLLKDIVTKEDYSFVDAALKQKTEIAIQKGIGCILKCQVIVDGKRTAWCAQHDETTLQPAPARAYEKISLSGAESAGIVRFLMGIENPTPAVIDAMRSAVAWFEQVKISGIKQVNQPDSSQPKGFDKVIVADSSAPPLLARFYEIGTNRPIFCGRDGVVKYSLAEIEPERRNGYRWYTEFPGNILEKDYPAWREKWVNSSSPFQSRVVAWDQTKVNTGPWGEMRYSFQGETFGTNNALVAYAVIQPGQSLHPAHRHAEEEYITLTQGSGTWHLDGKEFPAKQGDVMYVAPWVMHGLVNTHDQPLTFFVVRWNSKGVTPLPEPQGSHGN